MNEIVESLKTFFLEPGWLMPTSASVAIQLVLTGHLKPFLPRRWEVSFRDAMIWLMSSVIGIAAFVPTRWAWLAIDEQPFSAADFVLSVAVALLIIGAMPWIYSKLPEGFRQKHSYQTKVDERLNR